LKFDGEKKRELKDGNKGENIIVKTVYLQRSISHV